MKKTTFIQTIDVLNVLSKINISDDVKAEKTFNMFIQHAQNKYGYKLKGELSEFGIKNGIALRAWLNQEEVQQQLANDYIGKKLLNKIVFESTREVEKRCKDK